MSIPLRTHQPCRILREWLIRPRAKERSISVKNATWNLRRIRDCTSTSWSIPIHRKFSIANNAKNSSKRNMLIYGCLVSRRGWIYTYRTNTEKRNPSLASNREELEWCVESVMLGLYENQIMIYTWRGSMKRRRIISALFVQKHSPQNLS